jgi:hypothetical protein
MQLKQLDRRTRNGLPDESRDPPLAQARCPEWAPAFAGVTGVEKAMARVGPKTIGFSPDSSGPSPG